MANGPTKPAPGSSATPFGTFERKIARRYLGARKKDGGVGLIAWISFACIMLAVAAMIIIMSIMNGFRAQLLDSLLGVGGHVYVETPMSQPTDADVDDYVTRLNAIPLVESAAPISEDPTFAIANRRGVPAVVNGIRPADLKQLSFVSESLYAGSFDGFGEGRNGGNSIVIGETLAQSLGVNVGESITLISVNLRATAMGSTLRNKAYTVIGTLKLGYHIADSAYIYMPLQQSRLMFAGGTPARSLQIRLQDPDDIDKVRPPITDVMGPIYIQDWREKNGAISGALRVEQVAMRLILMIVVVIAVFPVISAMIMLVKNKGKDIAILRTMGASRGSILRIFFMAGTTIGAAGTLAGLVLGVLFCLNIGPIQSVIEAVTGMELFPAEVYQLSELPAKIEPLEVIWVTLWGFFISSIATYFPARGASRTDPVEALRYE